VFTRCSQGDQGEREREGEGEREREGDRERGGEGEKEKRARRGMHLSICASDEGDVQSLGFSV
jgi:hypothetical protein